ncbi:MAG: DUF1028 domain-containing protein [Planctomycetes bacterium]|nr:DUF1028 domain-containing protein [Planctomycetota bacterium]
MAQNVQESICSIVAADLKEGFFGVAVASSSLAVGKTVPFTGAFAGAIAVQGYTSPYFGIAGMKRLRDGLSADAVLEEIMAGDPIRESRQILLIDVGGQTATFTGSQLFDYAGSLAGHHYIIGGCGLAGLEVLRAAAGAYESCKGDFAEKLVAAVTAAQDESNRAPFESAALRISRDEPFPYIDLRVDSHNEPVGELARLLAMWREKNAPSDHPARESRDQSN